MSCLIELLREHLPCRGMINGVPCSPFFPLVTNMRAMMGHGSDVEIIIIDVRFEHFNQNKTEKWIVLKMRARSQS